MKQPEIVNSLINTDETVQNDQQLKNNRQSQVGKQVQTDGKSKLTDIPKSEQSKTVQQPPLQTKITMTNSPKQRITQNHNSGTTKIDQITKEKANSKNISNLPASSNGSAVKTADD